MFWHNLKYEVLSGLRVKDVLFWLILFPIVLATFFKIAFGSIYEKTTLFSTIPMAVVETTEQPVLHTVLDNLESEKEPLFAVTYTDEQTAPERMEAVIAALNDTVVGNQKIAMTSGNPDATTNYFYNLLAMVAMFGSLTGMHIAINGQGNLSALGARKCCSPTPKLVSLLASLVGSYILQTVCMSIAVTYLVFVLKVQFVGNIGLIYLSAILSGLFGVSLGFSIGSFGTLQQGAKVGIAMTFSMLSCFCSGLMASGIRPYLAEHVPLFHSINPASLICDLFYCLNMDGNYQRYLVKLGTILGMSVLCTMIGFLLTRRRKYASL